MIRKTYITAAMMALALMLAGCAAKTAGNETQNTAQENAKTEAAAKEESGSQ